MTVRSRILLNQKQVFKIIITAAIITLSFPKWTLETNSVLSTIRRSLSSDESFESCTISTITLPTTPLIPTYAASYPGSGSQMAHYLFEALTGYEAGDEWYHRGDTYDRITIHTHFPARPHRVEGDRLMNRVVLLIRNPMRALPSHFHDWYEKEHHLPDRTIRAPDRAWIEWRDVRFREELGRWKDHLTYWVSNYSNHYSHMALVEDEPTKDDTDSSRHVESPPIDGGNKLLVTSYEHLTHPKMGPIETSRIASFLGRSQGVKVIPASSIPCVWDSVVNYKRVDIDDEGNILEPLPELEQLEHELEQLKLTMDSENYEADEGLKKRLRRKRRQQEENIKIIQEQHRTLKQPPIVGEGKPIKRRVKYIRNEDSTEQAQGDIDYEFTTEQLQAMRSVLSQLRGQFLMEYTLVIILSEYIEEVNHAIDKMNS